MQLDKETREFFKGEKPNKAETEEYQEMNLAVMRMCKDILSQQSFVYNQISSFDDFIGSESGIKNILKNLFRITNIVQVEQGKTIDVKGVQKPVGSIEIDVQFANVTVKQNNIDQEEIQDLGVGQDKMGYQKYTMKDINLPTNCRLQCRTLKIDILADIIIKLTTWSEPEGQGEEVDRRQEIMSQQTVAQIPLMVGSKFLGITFKNKEQRIRLQECPLDLGGYFIIKGNEWSMDFTESVKFNELQLRHEVKNKRIKGFVMSRNGDTYELSYQTSIFFYYKKGLISVNLDHERFKLVEIPFFLIFQLFGISNQIEMTEMIIQDDIKSEDKLSVQLKNLIQQAVDNEYQYFEDCSQLHTQLEVAQKIANVLNQDQIKKKLLENVLQYTPDRVRDTFHVFFLSHLGTTSQQSYVKMKYFGDQIRRVLIAYLSNQFPDQHTYLDKRIHATGYTFAKTFKKTFNHQVVVQVRMKMIKELQKVRDIHKVDVVQIIKTQLVTDIQNKMLQRSIVIGHGADIGKTRNQHMKNRVQSQKLNRKNIINSISQMRMINNQKQSLDKQSKKIIEQRSVQPSFAGYVCIMQAVDNGEKSGKVKSLASLSVITNAYSSKKVSDTCWMLLEKILYDIETFESKDIKKYGLQRFHVNGFWIGYIQQEKIQEAATILREHRRSNFIEWKHVSVYVTEEMDLYVYSDYGRILVPMVIVHKDKSGKLYTNLNRENVEHILSGKATIDWYLEKQIFEYISVEESHNCLVAETPEVFVCRNNEKQRSVKETRYDYTHIFIPPSMLGIVALLSPFVNHTQSKRITMFTNQAKQSCGWSMYNYPFRMDKGLIVQQYVNQHLVKTLIHDFFPPDGQQILVAYAIYNGFNQDDSVIMNKGSVDQGLFNAVYYNYEETQVKYNETINNITGVQPPGQYGNYKKLVNGIITKGVWVEDDDVLVAKRENTKSGDPNNTSLLYKGEQRAYVEDVHIFFDEQSVMTIRIKLKTVRNLTQGDKLSSGQGCKAIVSQILPPHEMPYTRDGTVPDLIFNVHSVPTRFMIGQMLEASFQRICVEALDTFDATVFNEISIEFVNQMMDKLQIEDKGYVHMYNPDSGERIQTKIFLVPTFYYRLQKFASNAKYCVNNATIDILTRQAVASRKNNGSLRQGEMEVATFYSSGTSSIFDEKLYTHSDHHNIVLCQKCGNKCDFNPSKQYQTYSCSICGDQADIKQYNGSWASLVFISTLEAMGVNMQLMPEKTVIEQNDTIVEEDNEDDIE